MPRKSPNPKNGANIIQYLPPPEPFSTTCQDILLQISPQLSITPAFLHVFFHTASKRLLVCAPAPSGPQQAVICIDVSTHHHTKALDLDRLGRQKSPFQCSKGLVYVSSCMAQHPISEPCIEKCDTKFGRISR